MSRGEIKSRDVVGLAESQSHLSARKGPKSPAAETRLWRTGASGEPDPRLRERLLTFRHVLVLVVLVVVLVAAVERVSVVGVSGPVGA